jgi:outer membrane protein assembly factor BamB
MVRCASLFAMMFCSAIAFAPHARAAAAATISVGRAEAPPGSSLTISGTGFGAAEHVTLTLGHSVVIGTTTTGSKGGFKTVVVIPPSTHPGAYNVYAVGARSRRSARHSLPVRTSWSTFQYSMTRTGVNPWENVLSVNNTSSLEVTWSKTGQAGAGTSPILSQGRVFVGQGSTLVARAPLDGRVLWSRAMGGELTATPAVSGDSVIVPVGFAQVVALRADTGSVIWQFNAGRMAAFNDSAAVASSRVFVSGNGRLYALALGTGRQLWSRPMTAVHGPPALWNGKLLIGHQTSITAYSQATGAVLWNNPLPSGYRSTPAIVNGVAYWADGESLRALNADTGAEIWSRPNVIGSYPAVSGSIIYLPETDGLHAYSTVDGSNLWSIPTDDPLDDEAAIVANGVVYFGENHFSTLPGDGNGELIAADASTGTVLLDTPMGAPIRRGPIVVNGRVVLSTTANVVSSLSPAS